MRDAQVLDVGSAQGSDFFPPTLGWQIQIFRTNQIPDTAALVHFADARPEAVKLGTQELGFIEQYHGLRQQVENGAVRTRHRSVELPSRKDGHSARTDGGFDHLFRSSRDASAREARVDGAEQPVIDRRFCQRQQQGLIGGI